MQRDFGVDVGNGGFSLRSKSVILKALEKIHPLRITLGKSVGKNDIYTNYDIGSDMTYMPEDMYFSKVIKDHKIGKIAPQKVALEFCQEYQQSKNPLGGHKYWSVGTDI